MEALFIRQIRIVNPAQGEDFVGDLYIENGRIQAMGKMLFDVQKDGKAELQVIQGKNLVAAPGLVDLHVHLRDPGFPDKENIFTACRAAAAGGVTSLLAMPNTAPSMDSPQQIQDLLDRGKKADAHVYTTGCITKGLRGEELCDLAALHEAGAVAFSDDGRPVLQANQLLEALVQAEKLGALVTAHCEDLTAAGEGIMHMGAVSQILGVPGIPSEAEESGTFRDLRIAAMKGLPIHICHVSLETVAAEIRKAKQRGEPVTAETAPHYLLLTEEALLKRDADYRMNPPLRRERDRQAMIQGLLDGTIDVIATDHAPHTPKEKENFETAPNGVIGMEQSLSAVLTAMDGLANLSQVITWMSVNPAKLLGIPGGVLKQGAVADLVLFDPEEEYTVDPNRLHGKSKNTAFKGMTLKGKVKYTICGGRLVFSDKAM